MKIYRVAVFGCRAYHEHPGSEVVGLCDLVLELLATLGDELGVAGRQVMEILMGIFESCAYGRRVEVPQKDCSHPLLRWREQAGFGVARRDTVALRGVARSRRPPPRQSSTNGVNV